MKNIYLENDLRDMAREVADRAREHDCDGWSYSCDDLAEELVRRAMPVIDESFKAAAEKQGDLVIVSQKDC